jgi:hypothetical protein
LAALPRTAAASPQVLREPAALSLTVLKWRRSVASAAIASSEGNSRLTFSTALLFDDATSISKPRSRGSSLWMWTEAFPAFSVSPERAKASSGSSKAHIASALRTTSAATRSRRSVVLPVPGGPFTGRSPVSGEPAAARSTAACCRSTSGWRPGAGQRPGGISPGATASAMRRVSRRTSLRSAGRSMPR